MKLTLSILLLAFAAAADDLPYDLHLGFTGAPRATGYWLCVDGRHFAETPGTDAFVTNLFELPAGPLTLTVTATNQFGESGPSNPVTITNGFTNRVIIVTSSLAVTNPDAPQMFYALCYRTNLVGDIWRPVPPPAVNLITITNF